MYVDRILCDLNDKLNVSPGRYFGLAYPVTRDKQLFPTVLKSEPIYIGVDDSYPITIYHRINGRINYVKKAFITTATVPLVMVVFGVRAKLKKTSDELNEVLIQKFPDVFTQAEITNFIGVSGVSFTNLSSNLNPNEVFAQEYRGVEYFISSEFVYFSISYNLIIDFNKDCLNLC